MAERVPVMRPPAELHVSVKLFDAQHQCQDEFEFLQQADIADGEKSDTGQVRVLC